jgi:spectinomycin phosphotransferase
MLEKPDLSDETIIACLRDNYGLSVTALEFLPIGNDATAWAYRVSADSTNYFLKLKKWPQYSPIVTIPRFLRDSGIEQVVAPLSTQSGDLWIVHKPFILILYPFIVGKTGMEVGLSDAQWTELGNVLKRIHATELSPDLLESTKKELFSPVWAYTVRKLHRKILKDKFHDPLEAELAAFWRKNFVIGYALDRATGLGRYLKSRSPEMVLCHSDIHTANVLIDEQSQLHIVDWDEPLLAPKERDLMFAIEGVEARVPSEKHFMTGYGQVEIDPVALAYYRYEWVVQEIGDYGARVFLTPNVGAKTKADAVRGFRQLFDPGDVFEAAVEADKHITRF